MASNRFEVTYTPECIGKLRASLEGISSALNILGDFRIEVFLGDTPIENSPLTARAFDMSKVKITDFPSVAMLDSSTSFISKLFSSAASVIRSLLS